MAYKILFDRKAEKDLRRIDRKWQKKILEAIEKKLSNDPYSGKRLLGDWSPLFRYRVGDYRIIYDIDEDKIIIEVIRVRHRKDVYNS